MREAVIVDAIRTPSGRGKPGGQLSSVHPVDLFAGVLATLLQRTGLDPAQVDDVIGGCVGQSGEQSLNVTRSAVLAAGLPESVPATTVDRQCGSSQQAVHFAAQGVIAGAYDVVIAGGVESMSRVPMGSNIAGRDHLGPALRRRYDDGLVGQGVAAELIAARYGLDRADLDRYAARSHRRAAATMAAGLFDSEIAPVSIEDASGARLVNVDETVRAQTTTDALAALPPAFYTEREAERFPQIGWHVTPGNSSPLTDGASAVLIMSADAAARAGLTPRAVLRHFAVVGEDPLYMLTAPIPATRKILGRAGMSIDDFDAYEINEAFASVPLAWAAELEADPDKLNPRGGAIALGHALGSSGTRLLTTLLNELEARSGRFGLQVMCEAGGLANATIIERIS